MRVKQELCIILINVIFDWPLGANRWYGASGHMCVKDNGILLPKLFWPTVRKNCSIDREKVFKFEVEGREFENFLRFVRTVKGQKIFW